MRRQGLSRRVLSLLLALLLALTCAPTAFAEESTEAVLMRLAKTEGTVSITDGKGRDVKPRDRMRLSSGYGLETGEASYAWINLDDAKLVKMDAVSEIGIRKSGRKLDVLLESGNLFFDVSEPLEDDESLNIRTSTMVVGVRGTSGWVKVIDQWTSQLYVLEGTVAVTVTDPVTGETKTETVKGGEAATCKVYSQDTSGSRVSIIRQTYKKDAIEGFVLVELAKDLPLREKIKKNSGLDATGSGPEASRKLKKDQAAVHEKLEEIKGQLKEQENSISRDPVWSKPETDGAAPSGSSGVSSGGASSRDDDDSGSSGGSSGGGTSTTPTETVTLTMPQSAATVNGHLARSTVRQVILLPGVTRASTSMLLDVDSALAVPGGKTLTLKNGVGIHVRQPLTVRGTLSVDGTFTLAGNLTVSGAVKAKRFDLPAQSDWKASDSKDSAGFYTLIYSPRNVFTINFDANGGTVTPSSAATGADGKLASLPVPTREGYAFAGWFTAVSGGTQVTESTVFTQNTTVYARWTQSAFTVTFDANGGTVSPSSAATGANGKLASLPMPTQEGYTFKGWFTTASGGTQVTTDTVFTQNSTVYAQWTKATGVTWRMDGTTLYIEGSGPMEAMDGYDASNPNADERWPWHLHSNVIKTVIIGNGITSIGDYAFRDYGSLTNATVPDSVTSIGVQAFNGCGSLTGVTIPDGVTSIGLQAFWGCRSLTSVTIPDGVTSLGTGVFSSSGLTSVTLPVSVTSIGFSAFNECNDLIDVYYSGTEAQWESIAIRINNDPLINARIHFLGGGAAFTVTFNAGGGTVSPTSAATGADGKLTSLPTPTRSGYTFNGWFTAATGGTKVTTSTVFTSNTTVYAQWTEESTSGVSWRYDEATKTLYITGNGPMKDYNYIYDGNVTTAPWKDYAHQMQSLVIENGVTNVGSHAFWGCTGLTSVSIPRSVTFISDYAFTHCKGLTSVTIPNSVTSLNWASFLGCSGLTNINIPDSVTSIGDSVFYDCASLTGITIPNSVTSLGSGVFFRCRNLTNVTLPDSLTTIKNSTFYECYNLTNVTIPDGVTSIDADAFKECSGLTSVTIPARVTSIGNGAFHGCSGLTSVTIPDSVTSIGSSAFYNCNNLKNVYFTGTETQWNAISIEYNNTPLTTVTIHYNSTRSLVNNAAPDRFTDVPAGAWYEDAAYFCREKGIMLGTTDTTFSPDAALTRAMMVTVLHRLAGTPAAEAPASFADVPAGKYYTEAVAWANAKGIVRGYDGTTFGPGDSVTRRQAGLILQRYTGDSGVEIPGEDGAPATRAEIAAALMECAKSQTFSAGLSAIDVMCAPSGVALDKDGNLIVTDVYGKQLWKVRERSGSVYAGGETVQDLYGQPLGGYNDAGLDGSYFKEPWAIAPFLDGWAVSDTANNVVRLAGGSGVRTLNGATSEKLKTSKLGVTFNAPTGLASDGRGNLYVSDTLNGAVRRVSPKGGVTTVAKGLSEPTGLCWKDGALYIAETGRNRIVKLEKSALTTVAGNGQEGLKNGGAMESTFAAPKGVAVGGDGSVYVADTGNAAVRKVKGGTVTTLAAQDPKRPGGGLTSPVGLLVRDRSLYVCDTFARKIFVYQLS